MSRRVSVLDIVTIFFIAAIELLQPIWVSDIVPIFLYSSKEVPFTLKYLLNMHQTFLMFILMFTFHIYSSTETKHHSMLKELPKESNHSPSNDSNCCN